MKSDIKLFIFEGSQDELVHVIQSYLANYAQNSTQEAYIALRWDKNRFITSWWKPEHDGKPTRPLQFSVIDVGAPVDDAVLEVYGNDAAVRCPACGRVYIISKLLNKVNGRRCPHCAGSTGLLVGESYEVKLTEAG